MFDAKSTPLFLWLRRSRICSMTMREIEKAITITRNGAASEMGCQSSSTSLSKLWGSSYLGRRAPGLERYGPST